MKNFLNEPPVSQEDISGALREMLAASPIHHKLN
jgi:hypothetical protein|tara:strand:- start:270 stop:371 length:102 start_codon:yes stop_codon:yes gene_type:complete